MSQITELNSEILFLQAELEQARCDVKTLEIDNIQWHDEAVVKAKQIEKLKAKCDAYEQALEGLIKHVSEWTSADMIDDAAVQAREVLAKYKGE